MTNEPNELTPYLLVRVREGRAEFARWRAAEGHDALALFLTLENAMAYAQASLQGVGWQAVRPPRSSVLEVLRACHDSGIGYAVLDPDGEKAKRVFSIGEILQAVAGLGGV